ncbi:MAG: hypothetical protein R3217_09800 [Gammaproteobacteria bacterium]|nr:hypothetical protein [Gammaproteobacteria bacterium]
MSFFKELKERNVVKVGAIYAITGWLVIQVASTVFPQFGIPDWAGRLVTLLIALGFPIALVMAWALELTPEGIKRAESSVGEKRMWSISIVLALIAIAWFEFGTPGQGTGVEDAAPKSIAVLPFVDLSPEQDQEWFTDGLTEEVLNSLARTPDLLVSSRTSSFSYKNSEKPLTVIADELGVAHVLEGSVRRVGDKIRVTSQLIRAKDGFHLWSENIDGDASDIIEIQERVATEIARAMDTAMDPKALEEMMAAGTRSVRAYELYLKANAVREAAFVSGELSLNRDILDYLKQAVEEDPTFPAAWQALASYWFGSLELTRQGLRTVTESYEERRENFAEAINMAIQHARNPVDRLDYEYTRALVLRDWRTALEKLRAYMAERPNDQENCGNLGTMAVRLSDQAVAREAIAICQKQTETGVEPAETAATMIIFAHRAGIHEFTLPMYEKYKKDIRKKVTTSYQYHRALLWAGELEAATELYPLLRNPNYTYRHIPMMRQACAEGRRADAEAVFEKLQEQDNDANSITARWLAFMMLGEEDKAEAIVSEFDTPELADLQTAWLLYPQFDPKPHPYLMEILERNQVTRSPVRAETFRCPPADGQLEEDAE